MKKLALVAVLFGVVSMPAFAQSKYIKEANTKVGIAEAIAPVPVEKDKKADEEKRADEREGAAEADDTREAATDADPATGETATDAAAGQEAVKPNGKPSGL